MKCIECGNDKEKLFKNGTCSFSCNKKFQNKKLIAEGKHNFITNQPTKMKKECPECSKQIFIGSYEAHIKLCKGEKECKNCRKAFFSHHNIFCSSSCAAEFNNKYVARLGLKRSKNEIYFSELCKQVFKTVLENKKMFDGRDADVILPDLKTVVFWNGIWHYKAIRKNVNLENVTKRDKEKKDLIEKFGYDVYIIKDMGNHNKKFVDSEFEKFLCYMKAKFSKF